MPFDKKLTCLTNYQERRSFPWSLLFHIPGGGFGGGGGNGGGGKYYCVHF